MSTMQKAIVVTNQLTQPDGKVILEDRPIPEPGPGDVLVEVHAAALNPMDWMMAELGLFVTKWPVDLGADAAGIVRKLGEGVSNFAVGDRVMLAGSFSGPTWITTFKQYLVIPAAFVAKVPSNLTLEEAATIPLTMATAGMGLYDKKQKPMGGLGLTPPWVEGGRGKYAGEPIIIMSGASGVGQQAIQFAKMSGFSPIITTASLSNEAYLKSLGATHVLGRTLPLAELDAAIRGITAQPVRYGYDAFGLAETQNMLYDLIAPGGDLVVSRNVYVTEDRLRTGEKYVARVFADVQCPPQQEVGRSLYAHLTEMVEAGDIKPNRFEVLPNGLASVPEGMQKLKAGLSGLKLIVRPQETPKSA